MKTELENTNLLEWWELDEYLGPDLCSNCNEHAARPHSDFCSEECEKQFQEM